MRCRSYSASCEACGTRPPEGLNLGIAVFGEATTKLGISEDTAGGYALCDDCAKIADEGKPDY